MNDPNERRTLVAIALSLAVFLAWSAFFGPQPVPPAEEGAPTAEASGTPTTPSTPSAPAPLPVPVTEAPCLPSAVRLSTEVVDLSVTNCGGVVRALSFPSWHEAVDVTPWWTWIWQLVSGQSPGGWTPYASHEGHRKLLTDGSAFASTGRGEVTLDGAYEVTGGDGAAVTLRRTGADGLVTTKVLAPTADPDVLELTVTFEAATPLNGPLWIAVADRLDDAEGAYDMSPRLAAVVDGDLEQVQTPSEIAAPQALEGPVSWFGVEDRYFLAALVPAEPAWGTLHWQRLADGRTAAVWSSDKGLSPGAPVTQKFRLYVGPKHAERLNALGGGLEEAANLGVFGFFAKILGFFLEVFQKGLNNWGVSILALTFMVRLAFYPLSAKAFKSAKMMQAVQPKLKELQEKYADDKEAQTRETMALFQKYGVNPLGGCLPMLLQMPVFFALYSALLNSPDLYHASFLYVHDLSSPDPYGLFPAVMAVGMVLQQRMTPMQGMDPAQQQIMKFMPLMFALFMFGLPAGLSLYYSFNTALSIAQQWYNTRSYQPIALQD